MTIRRGQWKTRGGLTVAVIDYTGLHWIGKITEGQFWHDRWWPEDGRYAGTSERYRQFDLVEFLGGRDVE